MYDERSEHDPRRGVSIDGAEHELVSGKQASRRTFLKAGGGLIAGAAAQVSPAAAAAQGTQQIMGRGTS